MFKALAAASLSAALLCGCAYFPIPPDPIRLVDSPTDVRNCRRLGSVSEPIATAGRGPVDISSLTIAVRVPRDAAARSAGRGLVRGSTVSEGTTFAAPLNLMRDAALQLGATDLLLVRRVRRDWSYVEGVAYRCAR